MSSFNQFFALGELTGADRSQPRTAPEQAKLS
jgi:hypothetical protein